MKKTILFLAVTVVLLIACVSVCFAQFDHSSFPTYYSFNNSQSYTAYESGTAIFDGVYTKGRNGVLGIGKVYTSSELTIKAIPYKYTNGKLIIRSGSSHNNIQTSFPTQVNIQRSITGTLDVTAAATCLLYDVDVFQISNDIMINRVRYYYCTDYHTGLEITHY